MFFVTFIKSIKIFRKPTHPPLPLREDGWVSPSPFSMVFTPPSVPPLAGDRNLREEEENRPTVLNFLPLRLSCKESSTSNQAFLLRRKDVTALRCSEPLRSKVGGASKPSPYFAGWDRLAVAVGDLMQHQSPRHVVRDGPSGNSSL